MGQFQRGYGEAVSKFVPLSTCKLAGSPPWSNREIVRLIRKKKNAWRNLKKYPTTEAREKYARLEREVTRKIKNAKKKLERDVARVKNDNGKKFSRYVKSKTKTRDGVGPLKTGDGETIVGDKATADRLNDFFASVFTAEDKANILAVNMGTGEKLLEVEVTEEEIIRCIKNLKQDSAAGPDGFHSNLLKMTAKEIAVPLAIIYKKSLESSVVPADWRTAIVVPIYKKGPKGDPGNYRPVSLTSIPGKILETLI